MIKIKFIALLVLGSCGILQKVQATTFDVGYTGRADNVFVSLVFDAGNRSVYRLGSLTSEERVQFDASYRVLKGVRKLVAIDISYDLGDAFVMYEFDVANLGIAPFAQDNIFIKVKDEGICEIARDGGAVVKVQGNRDKIGSKWPLFKTF